MKEIKKGLIISCESFDIPNDKTGEITEMLKVIYALPLERTDKFSGYSVMETYTKAENRELFEKNIYKPSLDITIGKIPQKNGEKFRIEKLADIVVK